jgi:hypothetical protein
VRETKEFEVMILSTRDFEKLAAILARVVWCREDASVFLDSGP